MFSTLFESLGFAQGLGFRVCYISAVGAEGLLGSMILGFSGICRAPGITRFTTYCPNSKLGVGAALHAPWWLSTDESSCAWLIARLAD